MNFCKSLKFWMAFVNPGTLAEGERLAQLTSS